MSCVCKERQLYHILFEKGRFFNDVKLSFFLDPTHAETPASHPSLVGGFIPIQKYARQNGNFPPIFGMKIPKIYEITRNVHPWHLSPPRLFPLQTLPALSTASHGAMVRGGVREDHLWAQEVKSETQWLDC